MLCNLSVRAARITGSVCCRALSVQAPAAGSRPLSVAAEAREPGVLEQEGIGVFSDYDLLKSVIVGRADGFRLPSDEAEPLMDERAAACKAGVPANAMPDATDSGLRQGVEYPAHVIAAMNDGMDGLAHMLQDRGVEVFRTDVEGLAGQSSETGIKGHSARDLMITIGDTLFLAPTAYRSRSHEVDECYGHVIKQVKAQGGKVVDLRSEEYWQRRASGGRECFMRAEGEAVTQIPLTEQLPLFDAANMFVLNKQAIAYLVSISANRAGAALLQEQVAHLGMEVVIIEDIYHGSHIDSTILPLSENKMMFNEGRISAAQMDAYFGRFGYTAESYIGFSFDDMTEIDVGFNPVSSAWLGINLLQVEPNVVCIETNQTGVKKKMEAHGVEVLTVDMPYTRDFAGAFHCVTCPLVRERA